MLSFSSPITPRQRSYLASLIAKSDNPWHQSIDVDQLSNLEASHLIDYLKGQTTTRDRAWLDRAPEVIDPNVFNPRASRPSRSMDF